MLHSLASDSIGHRIIRIAYCLRNRFEGGLRLQNFGFEDHFTMLSPEHGTQLARTTVTEKALVFGR
eukprot:scaffold771_cov170-Amphora_coffeaeformis.AAC.5